MSKRLIIIIVIGLGLILISGAAFMQFSKPGTTTSLQAETVPTDQPSPSPASTKNKIQDLLTSGKNISCTISYPDQKSQGTVYISNDKFRGDFTTTNTEKSPTLTHMIQTNGLGYFWTDGAKTGTKINLDLAKNMAATSSASQPSQVVDLNKEVETNCSDWSADNSKFTVPTDIKFTSIVNPKIDTSACDSIKDSKMKSTCIQAISPK